MNELLVLATTWMHFIDTVLNGRSLAQKIHTILIHLYEREEQEA